MTRRKKLAVAGIAVALLLAAAFAVVVALRPSGLEQKLEQVREGMTYAEVIAIMGEPSHGSPWGAFRNYKTSAWESRRGTAWVSFSGDEVYSKGFNRNEPSGFLDRVLSWLGL
jgi:outer membrane protein assembly factor BamE (lipoprotein component of BamABCDE complex)